MISSAALRSVTTSEVERLLCSMSAAALGNGVTMRVELTRQRGEVVERRAGLVVEDRQLQLDLLADVAVAGGEVVHRGGELGDARHHRLFERRQVGMGAREHFLQQDVAFAQAFEQRDACRCAGPCWLPASR